MELGTIRQINIDTEMQASYLDYAMSVIVSRALPDVRDGLKPVHRRILFAMEDLGLGHDKPYKKSARIVGEVLGKYHPHGDVAVYEAMVRMAQDFSLRYPLVDGQGNFGSVDGDSAAAMRYTEARLAAIAAEMLGDIEKNTVDWSDNFDGTLKEPSVLPAALPNLLVNGASGIAVGMATNIPPHNLGEVCDALCYLIDNFDRHAEVTMADLLRFIPGPDFPTGGVVYRYAKGSSGRSAEAAPREPLRDNTSTPPAAAAVGDRVFKKDTGEAEQEDVIAMAYASGKGSIVLQAKAHVEEMSRSKNRIVVTEIPYQANKTNLIERIAELARDGRVEGITDLRDESDRTGMRICIELTRTVDPRDVLATLFKLTPLQQSFGVSLLALVADENGRLEPRLLSLKRLLLHYIEHRQEVIVRRSKYELERARQRSHILEGLLQALDVLDQVIALIRGSRSADDARQGLIRQFQFTEPQAQAILDMQLRRLAALEWQKLRDEYTQILALIEELEALLASPVKVLALIKQNLLDLKARYSNPRRTQIAERMQGTLTTHDLLPDEEVWVMLAADGTLSRQRRGTAVWESGRMGIGGVSSTLPLPRTPFQRTMVRFNIAANTRDDLYLFSARGQATRIAVHQIPETGSHYTELSGFGRRDRVVAMVALPKSSDQLPASSFLFLGTVQGKVKRVAVGDLLDQAAGNLVSTDYGPLVIGLDEGDELLWADLSTGNGEFMLVTAQGQAIRFPADDVRPTGLPAGGVNGIELVANDRVVTGFALGSPPISPIYQSTNLPTHLVLVTAACYTKRVPLTDFRSQRRNGQGVIALKVTPRSGEVVAATPCSPGDVLVFHTAGGQTRLLSAADLPEQGRSTVGKFLPELAVGTPVERVYTVTAEPPGELGRTPGSLETPSVAAPAELPVKPARGKGKAEPSPVPPAAAPPEPPAKPTRTKAKAGAEPVPAAAAPAEPPVKPARGKGKAEPSPVPAAAAPAEPAAKPARGKGKVEPSPVPPAAAPPEPPAKPTRTKAKAGAEPVPAAAAPAKPSVKPARGKAKAAEQPPLIPPEPSVGKMKR